MHGSELWTSDGTRQGTSLLMDIWPGPPSPTIFRRFPETLSPALGERLVFPANDGVRATSVDYRWYAGGHRAPQNIQPEDDTGDSNPVALAILAKSRVPCL